MSNSNDDYLDRMAISYKTIHAAYINKQLQGTNYRLIPVESLRKSSNSIKTALKRNDAKRSQNDNSSYIGRRSSFDDFSMKDSDVYNSRAMPKTNYHNHQQVINHYGSKRPMHSPAEFDDGAASIPSNDQSMPLPSSTAEKHCSELLKNFKEIIEKDFSNIKEDFDTDLLEKCISKGIWINQDEIKNMIKMIIRAVKRKYPSKDYTYIEKLEFIPEPQPARIELPRISNDTELMNGNQPQVSNYQYNQTATNNQSNPTINRPPQIPSFEPTFGEDLDNLFEIEPKQKQNFSENRPPMQPQDLTRNPSFSYTPQHGPLPSRQMYAPLKHSQAYLDPPSQPKPLQTPAPTNFISQSSPSNFNHQNTNPAPSLAHANLNTNANANMNVNVSSNMNANVNSNAHNKVMGLQSTSSHQPSRSSLPPQNVYQAYKPTVPPKPQQTQNSGNTTPALQPENKDIKINKGKNDDSDKIVQKPQITQNVQNAQNTENDGSKKPEDECEKIMNAIRQIKARREQVPHRLICKVFYDRKFTTKQLEEVIVMKEGKREIRDRLWKMRHRHLKQLWRIIKPDLNTGENITKQVNIDINTLSSDKWIEVLAYIKRCSEMDKKEQINNVRNERQYTNIEAHSNNPNQALKRKETSKTHQADKSHNRTTSNQEHRISRDQVGSHPLENEKYSSSKPQKKTVIDRENITNEIFSTPAFGAARNSNLEMDSFALNKPNHNASKDINKANLMSDSEARHESYKNNKPDYKTHENKVQNVNSSKYVNEQKATSNQHPLRKKKNTIEDDSDDVEMEPDNSHQNQFNTTQKHHIQQSRNEHNKDVKKNIVNEHQKQKAAPEQIIANRYSAYVPGQDSSKPSRPSKSPVLDSRKIDRSKYHENKKISSRSYYGTSPANKFDRSKHQKFDKQADAKKFSSKHIGDRFPSPSHSIKSNITAMNAYRNRRRSISKESNFSRGAKSNISVEKSRQNISTSHHHKSDIRKRKKSRISNIGSPVSKHSKTKTISDNEGAASKNTPKIDHRDWQKKKYEELMKKKKGLPAKVIQHDIGHDRSKLAHQKHSYDKQMRPNTSKNVSAYTPNKSYGNERDRSKSRESVARDSSHKTSTKSPYHSDKKLIEAKNRPVVEAYVPPSAIQSEEKKKTFEKDDKLKSQSKSMTEAEPLTARIQSPFNFDDLPDIPKISSSDTQKPKPQVSDRSSETFKKNPNLTPKDGVNKQLKESYTNKNQEEYRKQNERYSAYVPKHVRNDISEKHRPQKEDTRKRKRSVSREDDYQSSKHHKQPKHSESYKEFDRQIDRFEENKKFKERDSNQNYDRYNSYQNNERDRFSPNLDFISKDVEDKEIGLDRNIDSFSPEKRRDKKAENKSPSINFSEPKNLYRPDSERKFNESLNMDRMESNNDSLKQQISLTPKIQNIERESPTLIHLNQNTHQQSAESEVKISPEKSYDGKEKHMSNLESEILNDPDSDSVNSKDDFWDIALPSSPVGFLQNSEDSFKDSKNLMHVDSEVQEFGIDTQNKSQSYNDPPKASQLYAAYMKNNPSREKLSDVEMVEENKNEEKSLIINNETNHQLESENAVSQSVTKDIIMNQENNFEKLDSQIPEDTYINHQASNNSQTLQDTQTVEPMLLTKPQYITEPNINEDRKSLEEDNLPDLHSPDDFPHFPQSNPQPSNNQTAPKSPEYRPSSTPEPTLTITNTNPTNSGSKPHNLSSSDHFNPIKHTTNTNINNTTITHNTITNASNQNLKSLNTLDSSFNHFTSNKLNTSSRDFDQDNVNLSMNMNVQKPQNAVQANNMNNLSDNIDMLDSDSDRSEDDGYDDIELSQISLDKYQNDDNEDNVDNIEGQKIDLWMKFKERNTVNNNNQQQQQQQQQLQQQQDNMVIENSNQDEQDDLFGEDWNHELGGTMLGRDDENLSCL